MLLKDACDRTGEEYCIAPEEGIAAVEPWLPRPVPGCAITAFDDGVVLYSEMSQAHLIAQSRVRS